jgi:hypothetical protein
MQRGGLHGGGEEIQSMSSASRLETVRAALSEIISGLNDSCIYLTRIMENNESESAEQMLSVVATLASEFKRFNGFNGTDSVPLQPIAFNKVVSTLSTFL